jgi:hypothetical protein
METLCSLLIGKEGNVGYNFIGRFTGFTKEEKQINGEHQFYMENATLNMLFFLFDNLAGKTSKWLAEYIKDSNGLEKTGYQIRSKTYY